MRGNARIRAAALGFSLIQACAAAHDVPDDASSGTPGGAVADGRHTASGAPGLSGTAGAAPAPAAAPDGSATAGAPPADITFELSGHVDAGQELQNCLSVQLPSDRGVIAVHSAESHFTPGSHHFLVYRTGRQALNQGEDVPHECTPAEEAIHFDGTFYEVQAPDSRRDLPPGIAHLFQPGEVLLLTSHYLNTTEDDLDCHVSFTLHTMDAADVQQEAGSIFFYNPLISIPPSSRVTVTRTCPITSDIHLALLWSHMHWRGVDFVASSDDPATQDAEPALYTTTQWDEPPARQFPFDPPVTLHAGSSLTYSCTYVNESDQTVVAGQSASTNEMCILHGMYWPRIDPATEECFSGSSTTGDSEPLQ